MPFEARVDDTEPEWASSLPCSSGASGSSWGAQRLVLRRDILYPNGGPPLRASVSLRVEEKQSNVPDVLKAFSQTSQISTEIEVLESRTLVEDATRALGLQVRVTSPRGVDAGSSVSTHSGYPDWQGRRIPAETAKQRQL